MENGNPLNKIGGLSRLGEVLIEKISNAIGWYFEPKQIIRVAHAEAEKEKIKAVTELEIEEIRRRALRRFLSEESKKQENIESITSKAIPLLSEDSKPQDIEEDWIANFFDKCRLVSDKEMQDLWAKILAGEANSPGKYSKRTVNFLGALDKYDAVKFTDLCGFGCVFFPEGPIFSFPFDVLIFHLDENIYTKNGITFDVLKHLEDIGLLNYTPLSKFVKKLLPKNIFVYYYDIIVKIEFSKDIENTLEIGHVLLSQIGRELANICGSKPVPGFIDYVVQQYSRKGLILSSPYPKSNIALFETQ